MSGEDIRIVVPASHPMLAGHFPGHPIVPGAYLLALVARHAQAWLDATSSRERISGVRVVKFTRAVAPDEPCRLSFAPAAGGLRFALKSGDITCATGTLSLAVGDTR